MIFVKEHEGVVAMADSDVIGKEFEEGQLYLNVSEDFYKGQEKNVEEIKELFRTASNLNLVGKEVVGLALKEGIINEEDVIKVQGVPHAQAYTLQS
jgi:uncharacterized protein